jgi:hypothetical protein
MPFAPLFFTGWESGNLVGDYYNERAKYTWPFTSIYTVSKTGSYGLRCDSSDENNTINATFSTFAPQSDIYIGMWIYPGASEIPRIYIYLDDGNYLKVSISASGVWSGYVGSTLVATGSLTMVSGSWQHIQIHLIVSNTGTFDCKLDGSPNFSYSGDTQPGVGTAVSSIQLRTETAANAVAYYVDDLVIGTGDWPGDLRVDGLYPTSDTATAEWTPSTGATNFGAIDERPASDTDYISTTVTGERSIVELLDFSSANKTPFGINLVARMNRDTATADTIKYGVISGATESTVDQAITTTMAFYKTFFPLNPDGSVAWDAASINALQVVFESVIA